MTKEEIKNQKKELVENVKLEFNAFRNDVCVNASQDDDFQSIIDDVSYIVERVEMMANELNTILNNLEELQEEEEYLDEEDAENE